MSAIATDILAAVKAAMLAAFPGSAVRTSKRRVAAGENKKGGWSQGYPTTCFVISCPDPEEVDKAATFERMSLGFAVCVEYVKPAQAKVENAVDDGPATVVEDPDVREKRETIRNTLYRTLTAVDGVFDTRTRSLPVYEQTAEGGAVLLVSGELFTFTASVPRPGA